MISHDRNGANQTNKINIVLPVHIGWIKVQLRNRNFVDYNSAAREVYINRPNENSKNIVNIPPREDSAYPQAWANVYNYALAFLEDSLVQSLLEKRFVTVGDNNSIIVNDKQFVVPKFDEKTVEYVTVLEQIWNEYQIVKKKSNNIKNNDIDAIRVSQSSVTIGDVEKPVKPVESVAPVKPVEPVKPVKPVEPVKPVKPVEPVRPTVLPSVDVITESQVEELSLKQAFNDIQATDNNTENDLVGQKISDGDILTDMDFSELRDNETSIVFVTCQNVGRIREEDIFMENAMHCQEENFPIGAFIYGKAFNQNSGVTELKKMLKLLYKCGDNFVNSVIYSINNDYVLENQKNEEKLLDFINTYNGIADGLSTAGYQVMISMSVDSGKILNELKKEKNIEDRYETNYMVLVREVDSVDKNVSNILVDPWNNYDTVTIKDSKFKNKEILSEKINSKKSEKRLIA